MLCVVALHGGHWRTVASILLSLNLLALIIIALSLWIGELPEDRKPFGPFTEAADFLGFLDEGTPRGRAVAWLRRRGFLE